MKRRFLSIVLVVLLFASSSCAQEKTYQLNQQYFFGTFDTVVILKGYTETKEEFDQYASYTSSEMTRYHMIFDQYHPYDGVNNLYAVNQAAPQGPAKAEPELIDLLLRVREWQTAYSGLTNPAMGRVLALWHDARMDGTYAPDIETLSAAAEHMNYDDVLIDKEAGTVQFADPELQLDLGAVAKGYAAQLVVEGLQEAGFESFVLNAGGNVICNGIPMDGRSEWKIAVEDVDGFSTRLMLGLKNQCIVTSGDYQRYYIVQDQRYHHLIDPKTLFPATHVRAVSILYPDSGLADFLSTAAFLLPYEESRALIESIPDAEATWLLADGTEYWTDGFGELIRPLN